MLKYIFLAFVQGIAEFLPISSSGHLAFFQMLLGFQKPLLNFDVLLHLATVLAVIVFLRAEIGLIFRDLASGLRMLAAGKSLKEVLKKCENLRLFLLIFAAFVLTSIIGLLFNSIVEKMFGSLQMIAISFFITGVVLYLSKFFRQRKDKVSFWDALIIGIAQGISIFPGISRSGSTICAGIFRGLDRKLAAKFSFLLSIPTIFAAAGYEFIKHHGAAPQGAHISTMELIVSFLVAFGSGYVAVVVLYKIISKAKLHFFAYYCWVMAILSMLVFNFLKK